MTPDAERVRALEGLGYTLRQAAFLVRVALHGGYFLRRHYVAFTGASHGQATVRFLAQAIARGHVRAHAHGRAGHVFHLQHRAVYEAIGEGDNRNRRPAEWEALTRKLLTLDFVLATPEAQFWSSEPDKVALLQQIGVPQTAWPARRYLPRRKGSPPTTRYFIDKMPWYREAGETRLWLAYVDVEGTLHGFATFLTQYRSLLRAVPSGVTYVSRGRLRAPVEALFRRVTGPAETRDMSVAAFRFFCRLRREVDEGRIDALSVDDLQLFARVRTRFASAACEAVYRQWLERGPSALQGPDMEAVVVPMCVLRVCDVRQAWAHAAVPSVPESAWPG
jgi:hypothetical protein